MKKELILILTALLFLSAKCEAEQQYECCEVFEGDTMKSIPVQVNGSTELDADDFNEIPREEENAIQSADIALSTGDLDQLGKAMAVNSVSSFDAAVAFPANEYSLTAIGSRQLPPAYFFGMELSFIVPFGNTITAPTLRLGSLAFIPILSAVSATGVGTIGVDEIKENQSVSVVYMEGSTNDYFLIKDTSLSRITDGIASIETIDGLTHYITTIKNDGDGQNSIEQKTTTESSTLETSSIVTSDLMAMSSVNASGDDLLKGDTSRGSIYSGTAHPTDSSPFFNKSVLNIDLTTVTFTQQTNGGGDLINEWKADSIIDLKIPITCPIISVTSRETNAAGTLTTLSPVRFAPFAELGGGGTWGGRPIIMGEAPSTGGGSTDIMKLDIEFDGTNL